MVPAKKLIEIFGLSFADYQRFVMLFRVVGCKQAGADKKRLYPA